MDCASLLSPLPDISISSALFVKLVSSTDPPLCAAIAGSTLSVFCPSPTSSLSLFIPSTV